MIHYVVPGTGIYGGIKVGCQFVECLRAHGVRARVVTPDGRAPTWFRSTVPVVDEPTALAGLGADDTVAFSLPHDHARLAALGVPLLFHCQGTDPLIDPVLADRAVRVLTCWPQATAYARERGRTDAEEIGIAIADAFFYDGTPKQAGRIAYMPRRGAAIAAACRDAAPHLVWDAIDGCDETETARRLMTAEFFLATSVGEWFGLPALEAMAAGCVVLTVPVLGGMDYLRAGVNCRLGDAGALPAMLAALAAPAARCERARLRDGARATAGAYDRRRWERRVAGWLAAAPASAG